MKRYGIKNPYIYFVLVDGRDIDRQMETYMVYGLPSYKFFINNMGTENKVDYQ